MKILLATMVDEYFEGNRNEAIKAAGINTVQQLNNYISEGREVMRLDNGNWIMVTNKTKIFKKPKL